MLFRSLISHLSGGDSSNFQTYEISIFSPIKRYGVKHNLQKNKAGKRGGFSAAYLKNTVTNLKIKINFVS